MKKLLFIASLLMAVLFVNVADAAVGSPMRRASYRAPVTVVSTVRTTACTTCGHRVARVHHFGHRHFGRHGFVKHHFGRRHFGRHGFKRGRRFGYCNRCGR